MDVRECLNNQYQSIYDRVMICWLIRVPTFYWGNLNSYWIKTAQRWIKCHKLLSSDKRDTDLPSFDCPISDEQSSSDNFAHWKSDIGSKIRIFFFWGQWYDELQWLTGDHVGLGEAEWGVMTSFCNVKLLSINTTYCHTAWWGWWTPQPPWLHHSGDGECWGLWELLFLKTARTWGLNSRHGPLCWSGLDILWSVLVLLQGHIIGRHQALVLTLVPRVWGPSSQVRTLMFAFTRQPRVD